MGKHNSRMKNVRTCVKIRLIALICIFISFSSAYAQSPIQVSGKVVDAEGVACPGITVVVQGQSSSGVATDIDGAYTIQVPSSESVLVFSGVGFKTQSVTVGSKTVINVTLQENLVEMDEVIVIGYGTQKKKYLVGAVSQVGSKDLMTAPMTNVSNLMTGKLPGVTSIQRSGLPGNDETNIAVRGFSTFNNSSPLVLVDGVERMLNTVNPADIENISVLKDAATSAIYGLKGGNGVILITTKKGTSGEAKVSYDGSVTFSKNTAFPKFLNGSDYLYWYNKASMLDDLGPAFDADIQSKVINGDPNGLYANTNWLDLLFKDHGLVHQHNISASGGNDKIKHYTSVGLMDQKGIMDNVNYSRYNVRSNIDAKVSRDINFMVNLGGFYENRNWPGIGLGSQVYMNPVDQAIKSIPIIASTYQDRYTGWSDTGAETQSPIASLNNGGFQKMERWQFEGNAKLEYDFSWIEALKGLKLGVFASYDFSNTANRNYLASYEVMQYNKGTKRMSLARASGTTEGGSYNKSASHGGRLLTRPTLEYNRTFGKHAIGGILLYEQYKSEGSTMTGNKAGFLFSEPIDIKFGQAYPSGSEHVTGTMNHASMQSYAGRASYGFMDRYLAEVSFRYDGSYKFRDDRRWELFPSLALGWVASEEQFVKDLLPNVDYLKFRASYGELGNDDVEPYTWSRSFLYTDAAAYVLGNNPLKSIYTINNVTSSLTWEHLKSYNLGFELAMWNGLLGIELDGFYKVTEKILQGQGADMPPSLGKNYPAFENDGRVDSRGFELVLKHTNQVNKDWRYSLTGSLAWAKNKVLSRRIGDGTPWHRNELDRSLGIMYGLKAIGVYQTQAQLDNSPAAPSGTKRLGDLIYEDFNGDGRIDQNDFVKIGRGTMPELNFSMNMNLSYKDFYMTALWQGVALCDYQLSASYGTGVMDNTAFTRPFYGNGNAPYYLVEGAWTPDNTDAKYPRLSTIANGNNAWSSSWWVKDGSYLRLKNFQFGYSLPQSLLKSWGAGISRLNVYLAGTNLLTFSSFKYVDPEMPSVNNGYYPQQKTYSIGLNITF